jgi:hypothetical protein
MNSSRLLSLVLFLFSGLVLFGYLGGLAPVELSQGSPLQGWTPTVNLETNQYLMWRSDGLSRLFAPLLPIREPLKPVLMSILTLLFGTCLICRVTCTSIGRTPRWGWIVGVIPVLITLGVTGADSVLLGALAWVPLLSLLLSAIFLVGRAGLLRAALPLIAISGAVSLTCATSANHLAPVAALCAVLFAQRLQGEAGALPASPSSLLGIGIAILPALVMVTNIPAAPFPDYPQLAHVVPDDGLPGIVRPLIGIDYPIQVLDRAMIKSSFSLLSVAVVVLSLLALAVSGMSSALTLACILGLLGALDTVLPEPSAQISPIGALSRLIPWGNTVAYTPYLVAFGAWLLAVTVITTSKHLVAIPVVLTLLIVAQASQTRGYPYDLRRYSYDSVTEISPSAAVVKHIAQAISADSSEMLKRPLLQGFTPSAQSLGKFSASLKTSVNPLQGALAAVTDGDPATRWTTGQSAQHGEEIVQITFDTPTMVGGIELDTGNFTTDFPRGLEVTSTNATQDSTTCSASFPSWQGSVTRTPKGSLYFTGQHEVQVIFPAPCLLKSISIKQTGTAIFDWSIAEIKILS